MRGHGFIQLVHLLLAKQRVVGVAVWRAFAKHHQARGFAVDAVQGRQALALGLLLHLHQQTVVHIRA